MICCKYKRKGSLLVTTAISIVSWLFLAYVAFVVNTSPFHVIQAVRTAHQAQQYADIIANGLKITSYDTLSGKAHSRKSIVSEVPSATGWESTVSLSAETTMSDNSKQRIATVQVFKTGDTLSRYSVEVPLSSQSGGAGGDFVINKTPDHKIELAYADRKLKAYVDGQVMDFSVRQLDSTQRRCVFNVNFGINRNGGYTNVGNSSYICEADGKYDISMTSGDGWVGSSSQVAYCYINGNAVFSVSYGGTWDPSADGGDGWTYFKQTNSGTEYLSKGDVISFSKIYSATIYLTPYK